MSLTLHHHPLSSFSQKVLIALYENAAPFETAVVDLGDPASRAALSALWPMGKMPVLHDAARDRAVAESSIIIDYLDRHHAGARPLLPRDEDDRLEARLWDRVFDLYVQAPMQAIVADGFRPETGRDPYGVAAARATLATAYAMIDRHMADREWAAGDGFSLADCAATPALFYAGILAPFADAFPNLEAYFERVLVRPSVVRTLADARPYFPMFPFVEMMPARFLNGPE